MPTALVNANTRARRTRLQAIDEIVEDSVLVTVHGGGGANHDEPHEQEAGHLFQSVDADAAQVPQHHLDEDGRRHDREDQPSKQSEQIIGTLEGLVDASRAGTGVLIGGHVAT